MSNPLTPEEAIRALKEMDAAFVSADMIAPVLRMSPDVLRKHVRYGEYELSQVDVCGGRVRFARKDFLQKIGEMPPDKPERTIVQAIDELKDELHDIGLILLAQMSIGPLIRLDELKQKEKDRQCGNTDGQGKEINHE